MKKKYDVNLLSLSVFVSLILVLIPCVLDKLYYFAADDYLMNLIAQGAYGETADSYLVYNNVLLGYLLKFLYIFCSSVNWYPVLQLGTIVVMFSLINYISLKLSNRKYIVMSLVGAMELIVVYHLTFTIVAYLCMGSGFVYLWYKINSCRPLVLWKTTLLFAMILVWGGLWRKSTLLTAVLIFSPLLIYIIFMKNKAILIIMIGLLSVEIVYAAGRVVYQNDAIWETHDKYNVLRSEILDYPSINYENNKDKFEEIGFSNNDVECIYRWIMADKEVFSADRLRDMLDIQKLTERYNFNIIDILLQMFKLKYNYVFLIISVISMILVKEKRWMNALIACSTYAMVAGLFFRNRVVTRVLIPIYILGALALFAWSFIRLNEWRRKRYADAVLAGAAVLASVLVIMNNNITKQEYGYNIERYKDIKSYVKQNPGMLFVGSSTVVNPLEYSTSIFEVGDDIPVKNIAKLGSWDLYSKRYYEQMEMFDVSDADRLLTSLAQDERLLYISGDKEETYVIREYVEEHVGKGYKFDVIETFSEANVEIISINK